jgi:hypothetical protein
MNVLDSALEFSRVNVVINQCFTYLLRLHHQGRCRPTRMIDELEGIGRESVVA